MRIGIDAHILGKGKGGVETVLRNLIQALARVDSPHEYFLYVGRQHGLDASSLPRHFHLRVLRWTNPWLERMLMLPLAVRKDRLHLLHVQRALPAWGCPTTVVHIHDVQQKTNPELFRGVGHAVKAWIFERSARGSDRIVTVSEAARRDISTYYGAPAEKIQVIPNGVDRKVFFVEEPAAPLGEFVLFAGAIERNKNIHGLLRAFARLLSRNCSLGTLSLVLIGGARNETRSGYRAEMELLLDELAIRHRVQFMGYTSVEVLRAHMNRAKCFVFPSLAEGFGLPPLEAMACGAPVVTSRIPAVEEVCGDAAVLVDPYDCDALATAMERVLLDPTLRARLCRLGLERAASFDWASVARQYIALYENTTHTGE